jgi:endo-1,4-beta-xylanase
MFFRRTISTAALCILCTNSTAHDLSGNDIDGIESVLEELANENTLWVKEANARIEKNRKARLLLTFQDRKTQAPLEGVEVELKQRRHLFDFGAVIMPGFGTDEYQTKNKNSAPSNWKLQRDTFLQCGFTKAGFNNGLKYKLRKGQSAIVPEILDWFEEHDIAARGHTLIWPGNDNMHPELRDLVYDLSTLTKTGQGKNRYELKKEFSSSDKRAIRKEADYSIKTWAKQWSKPWDLCEWDVLNEPVDNHAVQDVLGEKEAARWFKLAKQYVGGSDCDLYVNEYGILNTPPFKPSKRRKTSKQDLYYNIIQNLIKNGAPIDGIGFQSRWKHNGVNPEDIYERLERFGEFGLKMAATESEARQDGISEEERARRTAIMITQFFSHPQAVSYIAWIYMSNADSALFKPDGTPKLNAKAYLHLFKKKWNSDMTATTDPRGILSQNVFHGVYQLTVRYKGKEKSYDLEIDKDGLSKTIKL